MMSASMKCGFVTQSKCSGLLQGYNQGRRMWLLIEFCTHNKTPTSALPSMLGMICSPLSSQAGSIVRVHRIVGMSINNELFAKCLERNVNILLACKRIVLTCWGKFD